MSESTQWAQRITAHCNTSPSGPRTAQPMSETKQYKCPKCRQPITPGKEQWQMLDAPGRRVHPICESCWEQQCLHRGRYQELPPRQYAPGRAMREYNG